MSEWTAEDDAAASAAALPPNHPWHVVTMFVEAVQHREEYRVALTRLVTPESLPAWGDFSEIAGLFQSWGDWGIASRAHVMAGDADVCYIKIVRDVPETYQAQGNEFVPVIALITLVWRPEAGLWQIHGIGPNPLQPEELPRTSPNVAPEVDLWG